eukprot:TRINITY_DN15247_c0_g1_i1.p1 TRINITY_DN15247_c0_g1~~TRINITY_DN15247_c0_g1_i1.p1  ORF type:complete len:142 (-),score=18.33 TRINITY_DN15247_c0_g1_i1:69-494(-)
MCSIDIPKVIIKQKSDHDKHPKITAGSALTLDSNINKIKRSLIVSDSSDEEQKPSSCSNKFAIWVDARRKKQVSAKEMHNEIDSYSKNLEKISNLLIGEKSSTLVEAKKLVKRQKLAQALFEDNAIFNLEEAISKGKGIIS